MALDEVDATRAEGIVPDAVVIRLLAPRSRFSLRLDPSLLSTPQQAAGFTLDMPINRRVSSGERVAMRLGPDEWLLSGPDAETARIALEVGGSPCRTASLPRQMSAIAMLRFRSRAHGPRT